MCKVRRIIPICLIMRQEIHILLAEKLTEITFVIVLGEKWKVFLKINRKLYFNVSKAIA